MANASTQSSLLLFQTSDQSESQMYVLTIASKTSFNPFFVVHVSHANGYFMTSKFPSCIALSTHL